MRGMKYIVYETPTYTMFVTFPDVMDHSAMAIALNVEQSDLVSAGFVAMDIDGSLYCHGESHSLGLKSRGLEDFKLLRMYMR